MIQATLKWDTISQKLPSRTVYAVVTDEKDVILYNGAKTANGGVAITKKSALLGLAEYKSAVLVGKSESNTSKKDNKNGVCEAEARVRAFIRMLRVGEGTVGKTGYKKLFGNNDFTKSPYNKDMSTHPEIYIPYGKTSSSATGAYQIMYDTFKGIHGFYKDEKKIWHYVASNNFAKKYNITSFSEEAQDKLCLVILKHMYEYDRPNSFYEPIYWKDDAKTIHDVEKENKAKERRKKFKKQEGDIIKMIINNNISKATLLSSLCWASLPDAPYGQPTQTKEECKKNYDNFLKEELNGISDLYLKKGFLKQFNYNCCDESTNNTDQWHNPVDNPRITKYNYDGNVKPSSGSYGWCRRKVNGEKKYHSGLDLFAIPEEDKVYSCLKANIHQVKWSDSAGWIIRLKIQNVNDLLEQEKKINYKCEYTDELKGIDIKETDEVYFIYMHLQSVNFTEKDGENHKEIEAGTVLGYAGVSGSIASGGHAPHLHLEVATVLDAYGKGEDVRTNPARFIKLNSYDTSDQDKESKNQHFHKK